MSETISVRVGKDEINEISWLSREQKRKKSEVLREVIEKGLSQKRLEIAIEKYKNNEATTAKAAKIAGIPLSRFLDVLFERRIELNYTIEDFREDLKEMV